jgi:hypothetical protein
MRANEYRLLERCVELGLELGWNRAHKHHDNPDPEVIEEQQLQAIMVEVCEWFNFGDGNDEA